MSKYIITQDGEFVACIEAVNERELAEIMIKKFGGSMFEVSLGRGEDYSMEWEND